MRRAYVLMTGGTGMLGQQLLERLLCLGQPICCLARPKGKLSARDRVFASFDESLRMELENSQLLHVMEGDITRPLFGVSQDDLKWLQQNVGMIIHNAASLTFHALSEFSEPWVSNLQGSHHLLDLTKALNVKRLCYVSTAYVCGTRQDRILESELNVGQEFRNDYERSKFEAETLIRSRFSGELTVFRPAVIVGDSMTGETNGYHGIYKFFQFTWMCAQSAIRDENDRWYHDVRLSLSGHEIRNLIPVDWTADVMTQIMTTPELHGTTYHLAPTEPTQSREIEQALSTYFKYDGVQFVGSEKQIPDQDSSAAEIDYYQSMKGFSQYWASEPRFDMTNLNDSLPDMQSPRVCVDSLIRMIDYAVRDQWGKKSSRSLNAQKETSLY